MSNEKTIDDGGQAFPLAPVGTGDPRDGMAGGATGLTKREYFAALAMHGLLASRVRPDAAEGYAEQSLWLADALIAALKVKP